MTCGSTALANGLGSAGRTLATRRGRTALKELLPPATFLGREPKPFIGLMQQETFGSSAGIGTDSDGNKRRPQRSVEVQCGRMDVDEWVEPF